jgi:DNA polymerase
MLAAVGIDPKKDVYFTNLVRCRPPDNCLPTDQEIKACQSYLIDEIRLVRPKVILAIGATATKALTQKKRNRSGGCQAARDIDDAVEESSWGKREGEGLP